MIKTFRPRTASENSRPSSVCPSISRRLARATVGNRPAAATRLTKSATATGPSPLMTMSAAARREGLPHSTAAPTSANRSSSWSFSASPTATAFRGDLRRISSAARRPVALLMPWVIAMTRLRLNNNTIGSSSSRITSSIRGAALASASIRHWPAWNGMPSFCSLATNAGGIGGASVVVRPPSGKCTSAPFSATTLSTKLELPGDATQVVEAAAGHEHHRNASTSCIGDSSVMVVSSRSSRVIVPS